jgi:CheY-like chemotaxis protein
VRLWYEPGHGAQFKLRLPLSEAPAPARAGARPNPLPLGGSERLLVVEDDASVLRLTVETLQSQGYRVLTAMNAAEAMARLESPSDIELLFSDVVMPGDVNGVELAHWARRLRPELRVLLTSGYVGESAILPAEFPLLDKPYEAGALLAALRKVLDSPAPSSRAMTRRRVASSA